MALFLYVLLTSHGPNDWTLAALILGFTLAIVPVLDLRLVLAERP